MKIQKYGSDAQLTWSLPVFLLCQKELICENFICGFDLFCACRCPLGILKISNIKGSCKFGKYQNDHLDVLLQTKQKGLGFWFRKTSALWSKEGIMLTWSKMTICIFDFFYFSFLFLFCSVSAFWCLAMFENIPNKNIWCLIKFA